MKGKSVSNTKGDYSKNKSRGKGSFGTKLAESVPIFYQADGETVYAGENNAWLVFGRDRNASIFNESYGSQGATECGMVDIVVGRTQAAVRKIPSETGEGNSYSYVNPNFETDAARVYLSQKADIDRYIGHVPDSKTANLPENIDKSSFVVRDDKVKSDGKSGIAIIADNTRVVGRETIKLITHYAQQNSRSGQVDLGGIDIIAHNRTTGRSYSLQPMVKGDNLKEALEALYSYTEHSYAIISTFLAFQLDFNEKVLQHYHIQGPPDDPITSKSYNLSIDSQVPLTNLVSVSQLDVTKAASLNKIDFATKFLSATGEKFINSYWNKVN